MCMALPVVGRQKDKERHHLIPELQKAEQVGGSQKCRRALLCSQELPQALEMKCYDTCFSSTRRRSQMVLTSPHSRGVTLLLRTSESKAQGWWVLLWKAERPEWADSPPSCPQSQSFSRHTTTSGWFICSSSFQAADPPPPPCTGPATCTSSRSNTQALLSSHSILNHKEPSCHQQSCCWSWENRQTRLFARLHVTAVLVHPLLPWS